MNGYSLSHSPPGDAQIGAGCTFDDSVRWGRGVVLEDGVHLAPGVVLYDRVTVGAGSFIGPGAIIGEPTMGFYRDNANYEGAATRIGRHAIIRARTIVNAGTTIGDYFQTGPHVAIRERTTIGHHVSIGNACDIQYDVSIGDYTRLHSNVTVGAETRIGPFVWVHPYVVFTNDRLFPTFALCEAPIVAPFCAIAVHTTILPGAVLGVHTIVGAGSEVRGRTESFSFMKGAPAERIIDARRMVQKLEGTIHRPYPWIQTVDRGYPWADTPPEERRIEDYVPADWSEYL